MYLPLVTVILSVIPLTTAASIEPRGQDTLTIRNSNCPCLRHNHKWCFEFVKYDVKDMMCYDVGQPSLGLSIYDPWVSDSKPLECAVYRERGCQGEGIGWQTWTRNHECKEFGSKSLDGSGVEGVTWLHRSFRCRHPGWPEHSVTEGHISVDDGGSLPRARVREKKKLEKALKDRKEKRVKWDAERKHFWRERKRIDELEDRNHHAKEKYHAELRSDAIAARKYAIYAEGEKARMELVAFWKLHGNNETAKAEEEKRQFAADQERKTRMAAVDAEEMKEYGTRDEIQKRYVAEMARKRKARDENDRRKDKKKVREFEEADRKDKKRLEQLKNMGVKG